VEPFRLRTARLELVAATPALERAARAGASALAEALSCRVPDDWPPPLSEDTQGFWEEALEADPELVGWATWYWLLAGDAAPPELVGYGGFTGRPAEGACEVGYSVVESHHRRGIATEAVRALVDWAFAHDEVALVRAHTMPELAPSIGVLDKLAFELVGPGAEEGTIRYELPRR